MPNGLVTPGLIEEIVIAGEDYVITPQEFSGFASTIASTFVGVFTFGAVLLLIGSIAKGIIKDK